MSAWAPSVIANMNRLFVPPGVVFEPDVAGRGWSGLSVNELLLRMHLERAPGYRLRRVDLAARLDLSQSGVTRMLAPMEKLGRVERAADSRDARVGYVALRKAGLRLAQEGIRLSRTGLRPG